MGALALWGAVGGAAKGAEKGILMKADEETKERQSKIDHDRQVALERLKQTHAIEIEDMRQKGATTRTEMGEEGALERTKLGIEGSLEVEDARAFNAENRQIIEQNWKSIENELDRQHEMGLEKYKTRGSGSDPMLNAALDRYEKTTLTEQQMNEYGIAMSQRDLPLIYDKLAGRYYTQEGDKLFIANGEKPDLTAKDAEGNPLWAKPAQEHLDALAANPTGYEDRFATSFGYLPGWFLAVKLQSAISPPTANTPTASE